MKLEEEVVNKMPFVIGSLLGAIIFSVMSLVITISLHSSVGAVNNETLEKIKIGIETAWTSGNVRN